MKRKIAFSILVLILVSCSAARTEVPTQDIDLENLDKTATIAYLAGATVWVLLPNPSGLNAHYQLADLVDRFRLLYQAASQR